MHVIRHQAVAKQGQSVNLDVLAQKIEIHQSFCILRKQELPRVAPLRDMVRNVGDNDTSQTSHRRNLSENVPSVPGFRGAFDAGGTQKLLRQGPSSLHYLQLLPAA